MNKIIEKLQIKGDKINQMQSVIIEDIKKAGRNIYLPAYSLVQNIFINL